MLITTTKPIQDVKVGDTVFFDEENGLDEDIQMEVASVEHQNEATVRLRYANGDYSDVPHDAMVVTKNTSMKVSLIGHGQITRLQ